MRRLVVVLGVSLVVIGAGLAAGQAATRWVERTKADVRADRGSFYDIVDTVVKGEQVQLLATEARWREVQTPRGRRGWIFEAALAAKPVEPGSSDFLKLAPGDASTSATAASAGAKGIYAQDYARGKGYDYSVVQFVESNQPSGAQVDAFVRSGGLVPPGGGR